MEEIKIDLNKIEIPSPARGELKGSEAEGEGVRLYDPPRALKRQPIRLALRFVLMTLIFTFIFASIAYLIRHETAKQDTACGIIPEETTACVTDRYDETEVKEKVTVPPVIIDESKTDIKFDMSEEYSLGALIGSSTGIEILILHSHNSEKVSESISVGDAGEVMAQIISSAGINVYHCNTEHDASGTVGAYIKMKETLSELLSEHPDVVCVLDIHDSDSGMPVTFTVGTDYDGWRENFRIASAVCGQMKDTETAFRLLPGALGQDSGVLTLNVGICGGGFSNDEAREAIAALTEALIKICNEKASAPQ